MDELIAKLPLLEIPNLNIPIENIPLLAHPAVVHLAIAIPLIVVLIEIFNTFFKKRALSVTSFFLLMLMCVVVLGAYLTGGVDGKVAADTLSSDGVETLKEHKFIGIYLVYASGVVLLFKLFSMMFNAPSIRFLFIIVLLGYSALSLYQGKEGGELIYEHGANVAKVTQLDDKLFDLAEAMNELNASLNEKDATIKTLENNLTTLQSTLLDTQAIEAQIVKLNATIEALTQEKTTLTQEVAGLKTQLLDESNKLKAQESNATEQNNKLLEQIKGLEAQIQAIQAEKSKAQTYIETLTKELEEAKKIVTTPATQETKSQGGNRRGVRG